ncbi:uncharacterized protein LOC120349948 isoform X2 [Nilaparvata lugens]|uniref:uncharacterized protein LOC120349948 isoform X2 n=1 Tax=Nilaparvata lugens TaxID=108931 RepID=UPI00193CC06F|nr:uncharacterized protein LOC120349948 isoform X2 [Nilaparvata lugens]
MCQRQSEEVSLLRIKKQLEELWHTTELLIRILSTNLQHTKNALKPILTVERRPIPTLPDPIVISEQLEAKLCEKIDQVISFTHSAVERSKGCLMTVDGKLQKKLVVNPTAGHSRHSDSTLGKNVNDESNLKSKFSGRIRKSAGHNNAEFLKTTYGCAFSKPKRNSSDKSSKSTTVCTKNHHSRFTVRNHTSENILDNPFKDIDELVRSAKTCSKNVVQVGVDSVPDNTKIEYSRTSINLEEAIKKGFIEPHKELIQFISSYRKCLDQLSHPTNHCENVHRSRFLQKLEKRNEMLYASSDDSQRELQLHFENSSINSDDTDNLSILLAANFQTCLRNTKDLTSGWI